MKRVLLVLALLGMAVAGANADPTNLGGGALITHYVPEILFTEDPGDMCDQYLPYAITSSADQNVMITTPGGTYDFQLAAWYIIAAWMEDKEFCGAQFGFSDYDPALFGYGFFGTCFPPDGGLEIPSADWPGPMEGIAFVVTGTPWTGNYVPLYYLNGYAYGYGNSGVIQLTEDTTVPVPFGGVGNCANPPESWETAMGGMGINTPGVEAHPVALEYGACCVGVECFIYTMEECAEAGGEFLGVGTDCGPPNPCAPPEWACCYQGVCTITTAEICEAAGGVWLEGVICEPNPCEPWGVCCVGTECFLYYQSECDQAGGEFHPEWDTCDPNPCCPQSPAEDTSWGTIKALYR